MKLTLFADKTDSQPEVQEVEFEGLVDLLRAVAHEDKESAPCWIAGPSGGRTDQHVEGLDAWVLDYDGAEPEWSKFAGWNYVAHTTHSHSPDSPHWRVIVELGEQCEAATWKARYQAKAQMHDLRSSIDGKTCNPARIWFVPPPNAEWRQNVGTPAKMPSFSTEQTKLSNRELPAPDGLETDGSAFWPEVEKLVQSLPPCIEGKGGDTQLFETACMLRKGFRLTPEACLRALRLYNERCQPPWDEDRLVYKVEQAAHDIQNTPGGLIPKEVKVQLLKEAGKPDPDALWFPAFEAVKQVTKVDYLCREIGLRRGGRPCLWSADAKCGKSTMAAALAFAVAGGHRLWGSLAVASGPVCYVDGEDIEGTARVFKRLSLDQRVEIPESLHFARPGFDLRVPDDKLTDLLRDHSLVIFDTLRSLSDPELEENAAKFAEGLYKLARCNMNANAAIVVLHHNNRQGKSSGTAALFGASGTHLELSRSDASLITLGTCAGARDGLSVKPFEIVANLFTCPGPEDDPDSSGIRLNYKPAVNVQRVSPNIQRMMTSIETLTADKPRWFTRQELAPAGKNSDVSSALTELVTTGRLQTKVEGRQTFYSAVLTNPKD